MALSQYALCNLGLTEAELIVIRTSALSEITSGKQLTSVSAPGLSSGFQIFATPIELFRAATVALQKIDPDTYGRPPITSTVGYTT